MENYKKRDDETLGAFEALLQAALVLSPADRAMLADYLLESLDGTSQDEIDSTWREEIERRIRAVDECRVDLIPGQEVLAQLRSRFK
jgi:putative addiction module component (TIGR02574 family)